MSETSTTATVETPESGGATVCRLSWCRSEHTGDPSYDAMHEGPVAMASCAPESSGSTTDVGRSAVTLIAETPEEFLEKPIVCVDGYHADLELDLPGFDAYVAAMERYVVDLHVLRREFAAVLAGHRPVPTDTELPLVERTSPCTPWCTGTERDHDGELTSHPVDRFHGSDIQQVPLRLEHDAEVELSLEQAAFAHRADVAFTLHTRHTSTYVKVALDEARAIATRLEALAALGERHAHPGALPPLPEVLKSANAQVFEDPGLDRGSCGYALGTVAPGGSALVVVPRELPPGQREELIREQLAHLTYRDKQRRSVSECADREVPLFTAA
jgi:hypothetical protein